MAFGKDSMKLRQLRMKAKNEVSTKTTKEALIQYELELVNAEIRRLQAIRSRLEHKLDEQVNLKSKRYEKVVSKLIKKDKMCPSCGAVHQEAPPTSCYERAFKSGPETIEAARFIEYTQREFKVRWQ